MPKISHEDSPHLFDSTFLLFLSGKTFAQESLSKIPVLKGPYLGQKPPGLKPEIFWDPFIAPDESYLIFCSTKPEGYGEDDFYISLRNKDLSWSKPVIMGECRV